MVRPWYPNWLRHISHGSRDELLLQADLNVTNIIPNLTYSNAGNRSKNWIRKLSIFWSTWLILHDQCCNVMMAAFARGRQSNSDHTRSEQTIRRMGMRIWSIGFNWSGWNNFQSCMIYPEPRLTSDFQFPATDFGPVYRQGKHLISLNLLVFTP